MNKQKTAVPLKGNTPRRECSTGGPWSRILSELAVTVVLGLFFLHPAMAQDGLTTIGYTEEVILLPWGIKLPARIDTGASMTSLDARNIVIKENTVRFKLPETFGDREFEQPIVRWGHVSSSMGIQQRPVVEVDLCVGDRRFKVKVNLNDRSGVKNPLIIGRNLLRKKFLVDPGKRLILPPSCPDSSSQPGLHTSP